PWGWAGPAPGCTGWAGWPDCAAGAVGAGVDVVGSATNAPSMAAAWEVGAAGWRPPAARGRRGRAAPPPGGGRRMLDGLRRGWRRALPGRLAGHAGEPA